MNEFLPHPSELFSKVSEGVLSAINSGSAVDLALKGVLAYLLAVWIAFVIWVVKDITNRSESLVAQTLSILLVVAFTPIFGLPLYLLVRPRSTLFERYYEELWLAQAEEVEESICSECGGTVGNDHRYCAHCGNELLAPCRSCGELIGKNWEHCAYCGKEIGKSEKKPVARKKAAQNPAEEKKNPSPERRQRKTPPKKAAGETERITEASPPKEKAEPAPKTKRVSIVAMEEIPEAGK